MPERILDGSQVATAGLLTNYVRTITPNFAVSLVTGGKPLPISGARVVDGVLMLYGEPKKPKKAAPEAVKAKPKRQLFYKSRPEGSDVE